MGTGKDEIIKKQNEELETSADMLDEEEAENEAFEAMNNMFEQAEKEAAEKAAQQEDDANLEAVANMFAQADEEYAAKEAAEEAAKNAPAEDNDEEEKNTAEEDNTPKPKPSDDDDKKKKHKDPMMELVEELNDWVKSVNAQITDFAKSQGKDAWDALNNTQPMKTLNGAMDELSQFAKQKVGDQVDKIANSDEVDQAKEFVKGMQDVVNGAFSKLMNMAANAVADAVKGITSPSPQVQTPTDTADDTFTNDGIDEMDELDAQDELDNSDDDDETLEAVGKMFNDAEAEVEENETLEAVGRMFNDAELSVPENSATGEEPTNDLMNAMKDMPDSSGEGINQGVDSDLTEEAGNALSM
ncbi:hypothetical protein [Legionella saoudiensis]|uniref:hypothetical protein n=1 Tax=Legionella saoudiensis TaxID=1750561 RepID=UPI0007304AC4|nr:hypothetical protein [Legionella saoudiensis]